MRNLVVFRAELIFERWNTIRAPAGCRAQTLCRFLHVVGLLGL